MVDVTVIGCGNMGSALVTGLSRADRHDVTAYDVDSSALESVAPYCQQTTTDIDEAAESAVVMLTVKPDVVGTVLIIGSAWLVANAETLRREALTYDDCEQYRLMIFVIITAGYYLASTL